MKHLRVLAALFGALLLAAVEAGPAFANGAALVTGGGWAYDTAAPKFGTGDRSAGYAYGSNAFPTSGTAFRVDCWGKSPTASGVQVLCGATGGGWFMGVNAGKPTANNAAAMTSATSVAGDGLYHLYTYEDDGTGNVRFYLDGNLVGSTTGATEPATSAGLSIGGYNASGSGWSFIWSGLADEVDSFMGESYMGSSFTVPTNAYTGTEANQLSLYHLDSSTADATSTPVATTYTLSGPSSGAVNVASGNFTVAANGSLASAVTVTPSDGGGGGAFSPSTVSLTTASPSGTFTYTPASAGTKTISSTNSGTLTNPAAVTYSVNNGALIAANNPGFLYSPYTWNHQTSPGVAAITDDSGAYVRTFFTGSATCAINFDISGDQLPPSIWWRVDGGLGQWTQAAAAASVPCSIPSLTSGATNVPYHTLEVVVESTYPGSNSINRWSTPLAAGVTFLGVTLDAGAALVQPKAYPKRALFLGNSICEGLWVMNQNATPNIDAKESWSSQLGQSLNAEYGISCFAGNGLSSSVSGVPVVGSSYNLLYQGVSRSFSPAPDYIVIEEGTNDGSTNTTAAATGLINGLESAAPNAQIFLLRPFNGSAQTSFLQAACAASNSPPKCHFIDTTGMLINAYGIDTSASLHPSGPNDAAEVAPQLAAAIQSILNGTATSAPTFRPTFH